MRKGIATQTNRFELWDIGKRTLGVVTVQLPAFEIATNEFKGAGVGGAINVPAPGIMNAQVVTISVAKMYGDAIRYLALGTTRTIDLRSEVNVADPQTHAINRVPERWVLKGPLSKSDPGKIENAAAGDASVDMQVYYAAHWLDGDSVLEWDVFNAVYTVNGVDLLAETRRNLLL